MAELSKEIVVMKGIHKSFVGVQALQDVDFTLNRGEIRPGRGEWGWHIHPDQGDDRR